MLAAQKKIKSLKKKIKLLKLFKIERPFPNESPSKAGYLAIKQLMGQHCCRQMLHSVQKATTKGVKKAISPANEWRCLWVCVCAKVWASVCAHSPLTPFSYHAVSPWVLVFVCPRESLPGLEPELKSKQKCFHVWACQQIYPTGPLSPLLIFGFVYVCVCMQKHFA